MIPSDYDLSTNLNKKKFQAYFTLHFSIHHSLRINFILDTAWSINYQRRYKFHQNEDGFLADIPNIVALICTFHLEFHQEQAFGNLKFKNEVKNNYVNQISPLTIF